MPELPEVETIRRDLRRVLVGEKIIGLKVSKTSLLRGGSSVFFRKRLVGAKVIAIKRRAKLLLLELSSGYVLAIHLKMTGQLVWQSPVGRLRAGGHPIGGVDKAPNKYTYITLSLSDGANLYFNDVRQFGYWQLIATKDLWTYTRHYGPEPLSDDFSLPEFKFRLLKHRRTNIKAALLNQSVVAGLGNIYVDESLFVAKVRPGRKVLSLRKNELFNIRRAIVKVLKTAVAARGTSFNSYVDALGRRGAYWQKRLVYGRAGEKCLNCSRFIKRIVIAGRGTHYCAICQQ